MSVILGRKLKMSTIFKDKKAIPVTLIQGGHCSVIDKKTKKRDGYEAMKVKLEGTSFIREFPKRKGIKKGDTITLSFFQEGDKLKITGISKGKGFQGGVKRWGFHGRNATHGVKHEERKIGSVGATGPEKVFKGKKMPGRMGAEKKTVHNLKVVAVDEENKVLAVKGAVPGPPGGFLKIKKI